MNKVKLAFIAVAILTAVGGAFATRPCLPCYNAPQYYWNGQAYMPAGEFGVEFDCWVTGGVCTYYKPDPLGQPNYYAPCHEGVFQPL